MRVPKAPVASYVNVAKYCGYDGNDREEAKKYCTNFAAKNQLTVSDLFDDFNSMIQMETRTLAIEI